MIVQVPLPSEGFPCLEDGHSPPEASSNSPDRPKSGFNSRLPIPYCNSLRRWEVRSKDVPTRKSGTPTGSKGNTPEKRSISKGLFFLMIHFFRFSDGAVTVRDAVYKGAVDLSDHIYVPHQFTRKRMKNSLHHDSRFGPQDVSQRRLNPFILHDFEPFHSSQSRIANIELQSQFKNVESQSRATSVESQSLPGSQVHDSQAISSRQLTQTALPDPGVGNVMDEGSEQLAALEVAFSSAFCDGRSYDKSWFQQAETAQYYRDSWEDYKNYLQRRNLAAWEEYLVHVERSSVGSNPRLGTEPPKRILSSSPANQITSGSGERVVIESDGQVLLNGQTSNDQAASKNGGHFVGQVSDRHDVSHEVLRVEAPTQPVGSSAQGRPKPNDVSKLIEKFRQTLKRRTRMYQHHQLPETRSRQLLESEQVLRFYEDPNAYYAGINERGTTNESGGSHSVSANLPDQLSGLVTLLNSKDDEALAEFFLHSSPSTASPPISFETFSNKMTSFWVRRITLPKAGSIILKNFFNVRKLSLLLDIPLAQYEQQATKTESQQKTKPPPQPEPTTVINATGNPSEPHSVDGAAKQTAKKTGPPSNPSIRFIPPEKHFKTRGISVSDRDGLLTLTKTVVKLEFRRNVSIDFIRFVRKKRNYCTLANDIGFPFLVRGRDKEDQAQYTYEQSLPGFDEDSVEILSDNHLRKNPDGFFGQLLRYKVENSAGYSVKTLTIMGVEPYGLAIEAIGISYYDDVWKFPQLEKRRIEAERNVAKFVGRKTQRGRVSIRVKRDEILSEKTMSHAENSELGVMEDDKQSGDVDLTEANVSNTTSVPSAGDAMDHDAIRTENASLPGPNRRKKEDENDLERLAHREQRDQYIADYLTHNLRAQFVQLKGSGWEKNITNTRTKWFSNLDPPNTVHHVAHRALTHDTDLDFLFGSGRRQSPSPGFSLLQLRDTGRCISPPHEWREHEQRFGKPTPYKSRSQFGCEKYEHMIKEAVEIMGTNIKNQTDTNVSQKDSLLTSPKLHISDLPVPFNNLKYPVFRLSQESFLSAEYWDVMLTKYGGSGSAANITEVITDLLSWEEWTVRNIIACLIWFPRTLFDQIGDGFGLEILNNLENLQSWTEMISQMFHANSNELVSQLFHHVLKLVFTPIAIIISEFLHPRLDSVLQLYEDLHDKLDKWWKVSGRKQRTKAMLEGLFGYKVNLKVGRHELWKEELHSDKIVSPPSSSASPLRKAKLEHFQRRFGKLGLRTIEGPERRIESPDPSAAPPTGGIPTNTRPEDKKAIGMVPRDSTAPTVVKPTPTGSTPGTTDINPSDGEVNPTEVSTKPAPTSTSPDPTDTNLSNSTNSTNEDSRSAATSEVPATTSTTTTTTRDADDAAYDIDYQNSEYKEKWSHQRSYFEFPALFEWCENKLGCEALTRDLGRNLRKELQLFVEEFGGKRIEGFDLLNTGSIHELFQLVWDRNKFDYLETLLHRFQYVTRFSKIRDVDLSQIPMTKTPMEIQKNKKSGGKYRNTQPMVVKPSIKPAGDQDEDALLIGDPSASQSNPLQPTATTTTTLGPLGYLSPLEIALKKNGNSYFISHDVKETTKQFYNEWRPTIKTARQRRADIASFIKYQFFFLLGTSDDHSVPDYEVFKHQEWEWQSPNIAGSEKDPEEIESYFGYSYPSSDSLPNILSNNYFRRFNLTISKDEAGNQVEIWDPWKEAILPPQKTLSPEEVEIEKRPPEKPKSERRERYESYEEKHGSKHHRDHIANVETLKELGYIHALLEDSKHLIEKYISTDELANFDEWRFKNSSEIAAKKANLTNLDQSQNKSENEDAGGLEGYRLHVTFHNQGKMIVKDFPHIQDVTGFLNWYFWKQINEQNRFYIEKNVTIEEEDLVDVNDSVVEKVLEKGGWMGGKWYPSEELWGVDSVTDSNGRRYRWHKSRKVYQTIGWIERNVSVLETNPHFNPAIFNERDIWYFQSILKRMITMTNEVDRLDIQK